MRVEEIKCLDEIIMASLKLTQWESSRIFLTENPLSDTPLPCEWEYLCFSISLRILLTSL